MTDPLYVKKGPFTDLSGVELNSDTLNTMEDGIANAHTILSEHEDRMDSIDATIDNITIDLPQEWIDGVDSDITALSGRLTTVESDNDSDAIHRADALLETPTWHMTASEKAKLAAITNNINENDVLSIILDNDGAGSLLDADKLDGKETEESITNDSSKIPTSAAIVAYVSTLGGGDMMKATYDTDNDGVVDLAAVANSASWNNLTDKPSVFTPDAHTHTESEITDIHTHSNKSIIDTITNAGSGIIISAQERGDLEAIVAWYQGGGGDGNLTDEEILAAVKRLDGENSGLNADLWQGLTPQQLLSSLPFITVGTGSGYSYNTDDYTYDDEAIQAAFDYIETNGGGVVTIMEDVIVHASLELPSNIIFSTNNHAITACTNLNNHVLVNKDQVNGNTNIVLSNIKINGDKDNQSDVTYGDSIRFISSSSNGVSNVSLSNVIIENSKRCAIYINSAQNIKAVNINALNIGSSVLDHSVYIHNSDKVVVGNLYSSSPAGCHAKITNSTQCKVSGNGVNAGSRGYLVSGNCNHVTLQNCYNYNSGNDGFYINTEDTFEPRHVTFIDCNSELSDGHGFHIDYGTDHNICHCFSSHNEECGIRIGGVSKIVISDCTTYNNNQSLIGASGILLEESTRCIVASCVVYDDQDAKTQETGINESLGDYNIYSGNNVFDNAVTDINIDGEHSIVTTSVTAESILGLLIDVDGPGSNLDADTFHGMSPTEFASASQLNDHINNTENPHEFTAAQAGALPIEGGTLTGELIVAAESTTPISAENTSSTNVSIKLEHTGATKHVGINAAGDLIFGSNSDMESGVTVWHSGNDGSNSTLDAATLCGLTPDQIGVNLPIVTVGNVAVCNFYFGDYNSDTEAIQAAIDAVSGSGQVMLVSPVTINDTLYIGSNTRFDGGWNTITLANSVNKTVFANSNATDGNNKIIIRNIIIDGNKSNQSAGHGISIVTADADDNQDIFLENVYLYNVWGSGINLEKCKYVNITNITVSSCGGNVTYGSFAFTSCNNIYMDGCHSIAPVGCHIIATHVSRSKLSCNGEDSGSYGYKVSGACNHVTLVGCIANNSTDVGFYVLAATSTPKDISLDDCKAFDGTTYGFQIDAGKAIKLTGCTAEANGSYGIYINGASHIKIDSCDVYNNDAYGINIYNANRCVITDNEVYDDQETATQDYGIKETGTSDYNIITSNQVYDNSTEQITATGANTVSEHNIVNEVA